MTYGALLFGFLVYMRVVPMFPNIVHCCCDFVAFVLQKLHYWLLACWQCWPLLDIVWRSSIIAFDYYIVGSFVLNNYWFISGFHFSMFVFYWILRWNYLACKWGLYCFCYQCFLTLIFEGILFVLFCSNPCNDRATHPYSICVAWPWDM